MVNETKKKKKKNYSTVNEIENNHQSHHLNQDCLNPYQYSPRFTQ